MLSFAGCGLCEIVFFYSFIFLAAQLRVEGKLTELTELWLAFFGYCVALIQDLLVHISGRGRGL